MLSELVLSDNKCTMMLDKNVINRRNVKEDAHAAYRADRDFLILEVTPSVIAASYKVLFLMSKADKPKIFPIPEDINWWSKLKKLQFLHKAAAKIVEIMADKEMTDASIKIARSAGGT